MNASQQLHHRHTMETIRLALNDNPNMWSQKPPQKTLRSKMKVIMADAYQFLQQVKLGEEDSMGISEPVKFLSSVAHYGWSLVGNPFRYLRSRDGKATPCMVMTVDKYVKGSTPGVQFFMFWLAQNERNCMIYEGMRTKAKDRGNIVYKLFDHCYRRMLSYVVDEAIHRGKLLELYDNTIECMLSCLTRSGNIDRYVMKYSMFAWLFDDLILGNDLGNPSMMTAITLNQDRDPRVVSLFGMYDGTTPDEHHYTGHFILDIFFTILTTSHRKELLTMSENHIDLEQARKLVKLCFTYVTHDREII